MEKSGYPLWGQDSSATFFQPLVLLKSGSTRILYKYTLPFLYSISAVPQPHRVSMASFSNFSHPESCAVVYFTVVLTCISLMVNDVEHFFFWCWAFFYMFICPMYIFFGEDYFILRSSLYSWIHFSACLFALCTSFLVKIISF